MPSKEYENPLKGQVLTLDLESVNFTNATYPDEPFLRDGDLVVLVKKVDLAYPHPGMTRKYEALPVAQAELIFREVQSSVRILAPLRENISQRERALRPYGDPLPEIIDKEGDRTPKPGFQHYDLTHFGAFALGPCRKIFNVNSWSIVARIAEIKILT